MMNKSYEDEVLSHSKRAFEMWKDLWIKNCNLNRHKIKTSLKQILGIYRDKKTFLFAYGPSFLKNIEEFKQSEYFGSPDCVIGCVDKAFRPLVEHGVQPDYVLVADGTVKAEWFEGVSDEAVKRAFLITNVYASPVWSDHWAKVAGANRIFWYLNKDNMKTEEFFSKIAGYNEIIEAASNVGNGLVVFSAKILGSKKIHLLAFDYSWDDGLYYGAVDHKKKNYIGQLNRVDHNNKIVKASVNMEFSAGWLDHYIKYASVNYGTEIFNCTGAGIVWQGRRKKIA
jgi:hypothetical protein